MPQSELRAELLDDSKRGLVSFLSSLGSNPQYHWGFTVIRTAYGPGTDKQFQRLIDRMEAEVRSTLMAKAAPRLFDPDGEVDRVLEGLTEEVLRLFLLRIRSDKDDLDGASVEAIRAMMKDEGPGEPPLDGLGVVLLVDEEVLDSVPRAEAAGREPWIKVLELDYLPEIHKENARIPRRYFGWMILCSTALWRFWNMLYLKELWAFAPAADQNGRLVKVWDGDSESKTIEF
ncbi:hypothetical protein OQA88_2287 [Cercophora sp. LCS_1]